MQSVSGPTIWIILVILAIIVIALIVFFVLRGRRRRAEEEEQSRREDEDRARQEEEQRREEERRERTRGEFGDEYDRTARERGSEEEAERELRERRENVEGEVRPLLEERRSRYEERWQDVERVFVDNPDRSIEMADRAVSDLLDERNFVSDPAQSEEETGRRLAVMHPEVAEDYREARRARANAVSRTTQDSGNGDESEDNSESDENSSGSEVTEEMRQAIRKYRSVYERLMDS